MKTRLFFVLAVLGVLTSCAKEMAAPESVEGKEGQTVLSVSLPEGLKTSLSDRIEGIPSDYFRLYWSNGDAICVNGTTSATLSGIAPETTSADFVVNRTLEAPFKVLYPAGIREGDYYVNLPMVQVGATGNIADGQYPMVGYAATDASDITMKAFMAIMKVSVKRAAGDENAREIAAVGFRGRKNEKVNGLFSVNYESGAIGAETTEVATEKEVKTLCVQSLPSAGDSLDYFIAIPARLYNDGFVVTVWDSEGHYMEKESTSSFFPEVGQIVIRQSGALEFVPTKTDLNVEIANAQQLIDFATAYNTKTFDGYDLTATLTSNISFDSETSAAFNATGGIGVKSGQADDPNDYYFSGVFDGNDKTISGLTATVPIFKATGSGASISDFTVDNSCSFAFTHPNTVELDAGAVVGYNKGVVDNVSVACDVALVAVDGITQQTCFGGVIGRNTVGSISDCSYSGNITIPAGFSVTQKATNIGGLVGATTNAAGSIQDSDFNGTLENEARVSSTDKRAAYVRLGGIAGLNSGSISGCTTTDHPKSVTMPNNNSYSGTLINHTTLAYYTAEGGICGLNSGTVSDCTNNASVQNFILTTGTDDKASDSNSRYVEHGGIVGQNSGTVSGCINNAALESRCSPRIQRIGGIVGANYGGTVSGCSNTSTGSIYLTTTNISPYSCRVGEVGGIIGTNDGAVSNVQNAGNISIDRTENNAGGEIKFGGVIGITSVAIDGGSTKNISNTGNVSDGYNGTTLTSNNGIRLGGVVGSASASVKNVTNSGNVTFTTSSTNPVSKLQLGGIVAEFIDTTSVASQISGCVNSGEIYFNEKNDAAHTDNYIGGILGRTQVGKLPEAIPNVAISDCSNSGYIHGGNGTRHNGSTCFVAGVVAFLNGGSSISNCTNSGEVWNNENNNTDTETGSSYTGGIAAYILGTETTHITLNNCSTTTEKLHARRGWVGGVLSYGEYVDLTSCTFNKDIVHSSGVFESLSRWMGGIVGWVKTGSLTSCNYSGSTLTCTQMQANGGGGIAAKLEGCTVDGCSCSVETIGTGSAAVAGGAIVGISVSGNTIQNCHYKPTINGSASNIAGTGAFADGGGNVADL